MSKPVYEGEITMSVRKAISVLAHHVVAEALDAAIGAENIGWEDYPEVGENDFDKVVTRAGKLADRLRPSEDEYEQAYAVLADRADSGVGGV
jgi:hypothetical protein